MKAPPRPYKLVIKEAIMEALYSKMVSLASKEMYDLVRRNTAKCSYFHHSFVYNGEFYNIDVDEGPPIRQKLHPELVKDMLYFLEEYGHPLYIEKARVEGYLTSMLAYSPLPGDYLLLLPAALHAVVRSAVTCDWSTELSPEKIASFMAKYGAGYERVRHRMAINLIL